MNFPFYEFSSGGSFLPPSSSSLSPSLLKSPFAVVVIVKSETCTYVNKFTLKVKSRSSSSLSFRSGM